MKKMITDNSSEMENLDYKIANQQQKVKMMEGELKVIQDQFKQTETHHQKILGNMRNQLNKNISQTINEYKDQGKSLVRDPQKSYYGNQEKSFYNSYMR